MAKSYFLSKAKLKTMGQLPIAKYANRLREIRNKCNTPQLATLKAEIQAQIDIADSFRTNFKK